MKTSRLVLTILFALIVALELLGRVISIPVPDYALKPLIMIWIAVYFILYNENAGIRSRVLLAFFFSWVGDVLLMFSDKNEMFFFGGVGGFFVSQVLYILTFSSAKKDGRKGFLRINIFWILPFALYLIGIFLYLLPGLSGIMIPVVLVYALSLIGMSAFALNRKGLVSYNSFILVFTGSIFFVASDSMLAINKFHAEIPNSGLLVMATYIVAQYLIMLGLLKES